MGKTVPKKAVAKQTFDSKAFKEANGLDGTVKEKDITWIPLSDAFHEALKIPGLARGYFTSFRGYSNTGKSTAIYEAAAGAQKVGDYPVIIDTETNWNWEHARNIGLEFTEVIDEETGEVINYEGDFLFLNGDDLLQRYNNVDYSNGKVGTKPLRFEPIIEDVARLITELLDLQEEGKLSRDICFLWDSVGSLNGWQSVMSKSSNNQWNAGSMETAFKSLVSHRLPSSRRMGKPYTNTIAVVQKIWLDNMNTVIKHKGGETFFYAPRIIVHFGGILTHSTVKLKATSGGETYQFGIETKVRCEKNQVNGVEEHGKIASTPHGYWNPSKIEDYKKEHKDYILARLNTDVSDFEIVKEEVKLAAENE